MPIPTIYLDTTELPEPEQFSAWARHSANTALSPINIGPFLARGNMWNLGKVSISRIQLDPFISIRDQAHINATGSGFVQVVLLRGGCVTLHSANSEDKCTAPDVFIRDYSLISRAVSTRIDAVVVYIARDFLAEVTGSVAIQGRLPSSSETTILSTMMESISDMVGNIQLSNAALLARTLRDLSGAALLRLQAKRALTIKEIGRLAHAKAYIGSQPPGSLNIERMAKELGLSRSVLFNLFEHHGGVIAYDRVRRLRNLYGALLDGNDNRTLSELGLSHGFSDRAGLSRLFRRAYGQSMTETRQHGLDGPSTRENDAALEVRRTVSQLG